MPFQTGLRPVGYVEAQIDTVRVLPKGHTTGYGAIWKAKKDTRVAIVPVGWYNGFGVSAQSGVTRARDCIHLILSGLRGLLRRRRLTVQIGGKHCPVVGQIGMLHAAVDVSRVDCKAGDPAVLSVSPLHVKGMKIQYR